MKEKYTICSDITKELLDSIQVGDLIKVNDWKKPLKVKGVTPNYFVMASNAFGKVIYSVCEKKPWNGIRHNQMIGGMFHVGTDYWLFGSLVLGDYEACDFDNYEAVNVYLDTFELPDIDENHAELSHRTAIPIRALSIKKASIIKRS